jgi:hypothetical protein
MPIKKARLSLLLRKFFFSQLFTFWQTREAEAAFSALPPFAFFRALW